MWKNRTADKRLPSLLGAIVTKMKVVYESNQYEDLNLYKIFHCIFKTFKYLQR